MNTPHLGGVGQLADIFATARAEGRAALVGYLPAGFPSVPGAIDGIRAMVEAGSTSSRSGFRTPTR